MPPAWVAKSPRLCLSRPRRSGCGSAAQGRPARCVPGGVASVGSAQQRSGAWPRPAPPSSAPGAWLRSAPPSMHVHTACPAGRPRTPHARSSPVKQRQKGQPVTPDFNPLAREDDELVELLPVKLPLCGRTGRVLQAPTRTLRDAKGGQQREGFAPARSCRTRASRLASAQSRCSSSEMRTDHFTKTGGLRAGARSMKRRLSYQQTPRLPYRTLKMCCSSFQNSAPKEGQETAMGITPKKDRNSTKDLE